jgi:hypothetical protein
VLYEGITMLTAASSVMRELSEVGRRSDSRWGQDGSTFRFELGRL